MAISVNNRTQNEINLSPEDSNFVNQIHNEITMYGELPHSIPQRQIVSIIMDSARWFYKHYSGSWERKHLVIRKRDIKNHLKIGKNGGFSNITLRLPPQVRIVKELYPVTGNIPQRIDDFYTPLGQTQGLGMQGMTSGTNSTAPLEIAGFGNQGFGINNNLFIIENVVKMVESNFLNSVFKKKLRRNWNKLTSTLTILDTIETDIVVDCMVDIDIQYLYENPYFKRHVISFCHQQLKRKLGGVMVELPGGGQLSPDEICNKVEDATTVEEYIKQGSGLGALIIKRH